MKAKEIINNFGGVEKVKTFLSRNPPKDGNYIDITADKKRLLIINTNYYGAIHSRKVEDALNKVLKEKEA